MAQRLPWSMLGSFGLLVGACEQPALPLAGVDASPPVPAPTYEYIDAQAHLVRASMELRGRRPTSDEYAQVASQGVAALDGLIDGWLASAEFGEMIRRWQAELWQLDADGNGNRVWPQVSKLASYTDQEAYAGTFEELPR